MLRPFGCKGLLPAPVSLLSLQKREPQKKENLTFGFAFNIKVVD